MSAIFLLLIVGTLGFVVAILYRGQSGAKRVTDPSCGHCGYCVRGLETMTCPECGSDFREVGILTPGQRKPMSTGMRLIIWLLLAPIPAIILAQVASSFINPQLLVTAQSRIIFLQAPYLNATIHATLEGRKTVVQRQFGAAAPMQKLTLNIRGGTITVDLADGTARWFDPAGNQTSAPFDARAIIAWLNASGFKDPRVADRAADILTCVQELTSGSGNKFTYLGPNLGNGAAPLITAHPAPPPFTTYQPTAWTNVVPWAVAVAVFLAGVPVVLYLGRRVQSRADADQAPAHP